jgi:hypothetical protein
MKIFCGIASLRYFQAGIKLCFTVAYHLSRIVDMATLWGQDDEETTGVKSGTTTVAVDVYATAVPSLYMGNRLQNLLTMIDNSKEASLDFIKRVEGSVRLLYGEYAANSMEY